MIHDYCVIGGGIVGVATAMRLIERQPGASVLLLEKEPALARHQTGHNSGVVHAGIYYAPGSLKARLCREGAARTREFCAEYGISFDNCGKLVVATDERERTRMATLVKRAEANRLPVDVLDAAALHDLEPEVAGIAAILVPSTGIVDYVRLTDAMADVLRLRGGVIEFGVRVDALRETAERVEISAGERRWSARRVVVCGGLQADRLAELAGMRPNFRIVPFRGEYFRLPAARSTIVHRLIYPVPDPALPFLGVHLTRTVDGGITVGPNAVLGLSREGYPRGSVNLRDVRDLATFPGTWRVMREHLRSGSREVRDSLWKRGYLAQCRRYCPSLTLADLLPAPAGIRAQAVLRDGSLADDFLFLQSERMLHVGNAPSPAATSALPIADLIADRLLLSPR